MLDFCRSCLNNYLHYLNEEEINFIKKTIQNNTFNLEGVNKLALIAEKIWNNELASGEYLVVSWSKYAGQKRKNFITFATLNLKDDITSFCDSEFGIEYAISYKALIGALNKDGATLIEDESHQNDYTLAVLNGKAINSYNGATKIITPLQLLDQTDNNYPSKHNELILDSRYIREIKEYIKPQIKK